MKQAIREQLERRQEELAQAEKDNMPKENEIQHNDPEMKALLQLLLEDKAEEVKEKQAKKAEAEAQTKQRLEAEIEAAKAQNELQQMRRESCTHQTINPANMNKRSAWRAQVNSDGCFVPVCCLCQTVMPKIPATDEQKREGVGLDRYVELPMKALENWHKKSFDAGCDNKNCYVCYPVKELATA